MVHYVKCNDETPKYMLAAVLSLNIFGGLWIVSERSFWTVWYFNTPLVLCCCFFRKQEWHLVRKQEWQLVCKEGAAHIIDMDRTVFTNQMPLMQISLHMWFCVLELFRGPSSPEIQEILKVSWNCAEIWNCPEISLIWRECPESGFWCFSALTLFASYSLSNYLRLTTTSHYYLDIVDDCIIQ